MVSFRRTFGLAALVLAHAAPARAEGWLTDGELGVGSGLEGGDDGSGNIAWRRARFRLSAGFELRSDEDAGRGFHFRAFAELEKRGSVGGEARYALWATRQVGAFAGAVGVVAPETLVGGGVGARLLVPLGSRAGVVIEPAFFALPLGSDLPGDGPVYWVLVSAGVRLGL